MTLTSLLQQVLKQDQFEEPIADIPYCAHLGLILHNDGGRLSLSMPFKPSLIGSPQRLHGGTVGAMMEIAGLIEVVAAQAKKGEAEARFAKPISVTIDYLLGGGMKTTYASAKIERLGRRIANIRSKAWQDDPEKPIATAHMHVLLPGV